MSLANSPAGPALLEQPLAAALEKDQTGPTAIGRIDTLVNDLQQATAPVWPLADYVAVHPYLGWLDYQFDCAHSALQVVSDCQLLPGIEVLAEQFKTEKFSVKHIEAAAEELLGAAVDPGQYACELAQRLNTLSQVPPRSQPVDRVIEARAHVCSVAKWADAFLATNWVDTVHHEIGRFCSTYYDEGQATWGNPFNSKPLFAAWKATASIDRNPEIHGIRGFRELVAGLPSESLETIACCLKQLEIPPRLWKEFLLSHILALPGWFAWARYQTEANMRRDNSQDDFVDLLAIRLVYDLGLKKSLNLPINWEAYNLQLPELSPSTEAASLASEQLVLLRASELSFSDQVLSSLNKAEPQPDCHLSSQRKSAQLVFCIDVRSERIRRHLESVCDSLETFGFAGFFGVPMAYRQLGAHTCSSQLPVLLTPKIEVQEGIVSEASSALLSQLSVLKRASRLSRKIWKQFQSAAFGGFAYVESMGWLFGWKLASRSLGLAVHLQRKADGLTVDQQAKLGPCLAGLDAQDFGLQEQTALAEPILRNLGLTHGFARLVVFCGHASQTSNNPLAASLDCGACGGHSGEANARFAALLLNQPAVRAQLQQRGIELPSDTHFIAAVHNTTTDHIQFFDVDRVPHSHLPDLESLQAMATQATRQNLFERAQTFGSIGLEGLIARSTDWSEVRPEWGLAGNAAFIVAPRNMTQLANLGGRTFLHSYDHTQDPQGSVLELIMTAPMVVAHWINMQYYASAVDPKHFSSGTKTLHNVAGQFGVVIGNGGDLCIGLPQESWHNGQNLEHQPLRLLAIIAAPRSTIAQIIDKHPLLQLIFQNQWMHLIAIEGNQRFRLTPDGSWRQLAS